MYSGIAERHRWSLPEALAEQAREIPDKLPDKLFVAMAGGGDKITCGALGDAAGRVAASWSAA